MRYNLIIFFIITIFIKPSYAPTSLTKAGDKIILINPILAAAISSQEKGVGHFGIVYLQSLAIMGLSQELGKHTKWSAWQRPNRGPYHAMPSGHVTAAWSAASYTRVFSENKMLSIPLYGAAIVTAHSRLKNKAHTKLQVVAAVLLSELVSEINSRMNWSNNYRTTTINLAPDSASVGLKINF